MLSRRPGPLTDAAAGARETIGRGRRLDCVGTMGIENRGRLENVGDKGQFVPGRLSRRDEGRVRHGPTQ